MYFWGGVENFDASYFGGCKVSGSCTFLGSQYEAPSDPPVMYSASTTPRVASHAQIGCRWRRINKQEKFKHPPGLTSYNKYWQRTIIGEYASTAMLHIGAKAIYIFIKN